MGENFPNYGMYMYTVYIYSRSVTMNIIYCHVHNVMSIYMCLVWPARPIPPLLFIMLYKLIWSIDITGVRSGGAGGALAPPSPEKDHTLNIHSTTLHKL